MTRHCAFGFVHFDPSESGHRPPPPRASGVQLDNLIHFAGMGKSQSECHGCSPGRYLFYSGWDMSEHGLSESLYPRDN